MHQLVIDSGSTSTNPFVVQLAGEIEKTKAQFGRVFRTQMFDEGKMTLFTTTSKDIHLNIGSLRHFGKILFARALRYEFSMNDFSELLIYPDGKMEKNRAMKVSLLAGSIEGGDMIFDLSTAH